MSKIYIEVPKTTNMTTVSVPCGKEGDYLWQFTVMFEECEYLQKRIVTVLDNNCEEGEEPTIQSQVVKNENDRKTEFEYHIDQAGLKLLQYSSVRKTGLLQSSGNRISGDVINIASPFLFT